MTLESYLFDIFLYYYSSVVIYNHRVLIRLGTEFANVIDSEYMEHFRRMR